MVTMTSPKVLDTSFFKSLKIFSEFGEESLSYFLKHARIKRYEKGKLLFLQGDPIITFYIVRSGWIKLFRYTEDGTEVIKALCKEGDLLSKPVLANGSTHNTCGQVVEEAIIYEIPASILKEAIKKDLKLALGMISYLLNSISLLDKQVEHLSIMNAAQRVGCFLLHLCVSAKGNNVKIKLPCNKELIAKYLGMKPETFSRSLLKLRKFGVITNSDFIEITDIFTLKQYTCNACSCEGACPGRPLENIKDCERTLPIVPSNNAENISHYQLI